MYRITLLCLLALLAALPQSLAAPVPKPTNAKPAVINAGTEKNIPWVLEEVVSGARFAVRENKEVAGLPIVRRQKDCRSWLLEKLRVERVKDTNLVHVSFHDGTRVEQATIVNAVVEYYLKKEVDPRRETEARGLEFSRNAIKTLLRDGKITAEEAAKAEKGFKEREEYIRRILPALVEPAKAR